MEETDVIFLKHGRGQLQTFGIEYIISGTWIDNKLEGEAQLFKGNIEKIEEVSLKAKVYLKNGLLIPRPGTDEDNIKMTKISHNYYIF